MHKNYLMNVLKMVLWGKNVNAGEPPVFWSSARLGSPLLLGSTEIPEKAMATHSSVLAWRIPGTGEPAGLPSMGSHRVRHD